MERDDARRWEENQKLLERLVEATEAHAEASRKVAKYIASGEFADDMAKSVMAALDEAANDDEEDDF